MKKRQHFGIITLAAAATVFLALQCAGAPDRVETEDFDFANGLLARGMYRMASNAYRDFIGKYPESVYRQEALYRKGESYFLSGEREKALDVFTEVSAEKENTAPVMRALLRKGQIKLDTGENEKAIAIFEKVLAREPQDDVKESAHYYLAASQAAAGRTTAARRSYESFVELYGSGSYAAVARLDLGDLYMKGEEYGVAAKVYLEAEAKAESERTGFEGAIRSARALDLAGREEQAFGKYEDILNASPPPDIFDRTVLEMIAAYYNRGKNRIVIEKADNLLESISREEIMCRVRFLVAGSHFSLGDYGPAGRAYAEITERCKDPDLSRKAALNICWIHYRKGEYALCIEKANKYIRDFPEKDTDEAVYIKTRALSAKGAWEDAIIIYDDLIKYYPDSVFRGEVLYDRGWAYYNLGKTADAIEAHGMFIDAMPGDERVPDVILRSAQGALESQDHGKAAAFYRKFLDEYKGDPRGYLVKYQLGGALYGEGRHREAVNVYTEILDGSPPEDLRYNAFFRRGIAYRDMEEWEKAVDDLKEASKQKGSIGSRASESLAFSFFQQGKESEAASEYYRLITSGEGYGIQLSKEAYLWTADIYTFQNQSEKAVNVLKALEKSFPQGIDSEALYMFGENYSGMGKNKKAAEYYKKALDKGLVSPRKERCYLGLGKAYEALGRINEARENLEMAVSGHADNVTAAAARMALGGIHENNKEYDAAARQYAMVAILYDDGEMTPRALFLAAEAFRKAGNPEEAEKLTEELFVRYPGSPPAKKAERRAN